MDRLGEYLEFVTLGAGLFEQIGGGGLSGEEKDLALWQFAARNDCRFDAGHTSHDDIADEHVRLEAVEQLDSFFAAKNGARLKACLIQNNCESVGDYLLVVGDQNFRSWCGRSCWIWHSDCPQNFDDKSSVLK